MSDHIDAVLRLTGTELEEGMSVLITQVPGQGLQVLRLRLTSTSMEQPTNMVPMFGDQTRWSHERAGPARVKFEGYLEP